MTSSNQMATAAPAQAKPQRRWRKRLSRAGLVLLALAVAAHFAWVYSGSNRWEPSRDQDGVQVWTLKTPGSGLVLVKAHARVKSSLSGMVKLLEDLSSCAEAYCYDGSVIERLPTTPDRYAAYVQFKFDMPLLKTRQYVLLQEHWQDPVSKRLELNIIAAPNRIPRDECCVRIAHLSNHWTITPQPGGWLDIEFTQDTDVGGLPYPLVNPALIESTYQILHGMQGLMNMEKYRNARVPGIRELDTPKT
ncbi:hypothetical protein [Chromobacterium vaccinii]|uniref:hypothetical protein n=1 Tax=Chromobacterium vaccinii TaxID=1108595 RepID=UPI000A66D7D1|nr:hypothetical protein [Chromobacterium vaccinii]